MVTYQSIHAQTIVTFVFREHMVTYQILHAQTRITFVFREHAVTTVSMPKPYSNKVRVAKGYGYQCMYAKTIISFVSVFSRAETTRSCAPCSRENLQHEAGFCVNFGDPENRTLACNLKEEGPFLHGKRDRNRRFSSTDTKCCKFPHEQLVRPTSALVQVLENTPQNTRRGPSSFPTFPLFVFP